MGIDVLVFDCLEISRSALAALLERREGLRVTGLAADPQAALEFAELRRPDVVVVSMEGRESGLLEVAQKIVSLPRCRVLLLATACVRPVVRAAYTGGIDGVVRRDDPPRRLFEAIELVHRGQRAFDPEMMVTALVDGDFPLTARQLTVLEHLSRGDTVTQIAARMFLSEGTVRNYISSTVAKLGARNRVDALRIARESHWV
ncbi:response regulator transcription factor [Streptomyces tagetis]|uniref:Response regulator transcription factor n=1 Tax=Streptomyces tagetis TaxID=2820809 RepID=A0A940XL54_9ACTN|nr:response regulator transcription factor [Streptomyces sp. RG38]MBQ0826559.1 response regulator transcription factor [Streptomyces sp. RG38]